MRLVCFFLLTGFVCVLILSIFAVAIEALVKFDNRIRITMSDDDVAEYASTAHVRIGNTDLRLPFVALDDYRRLNPPIRLADEPDKARWRAEKEALVSAASDPGHPMTAVHMSVALDGYGTLGELAKASEICPLLRQEWARELCLNPWHPLRRSLPSRIAFLDVSVPEETLNMYEPRKKLLAMMRPIGREALFFCEMPQENRRCIAAILIKKRLVAYWEAYDRSNEAISDATERQGRMIRAFVDFGLGEVEDYPGLLERACELRELGSIVPAPRRDVCAAP